MRHFEVTYEVPVAAADAEAFAEDLLLEQTFETPRQVVDRYPALAASDSGAIEEIREIEKNLFRIRLSISDANAIDASQVLNAVFGNAAIHPGIRLVEFEPSERILSHLPGPKFGINGMRKHLEIAVRPITATALKPVGLPLDEIAGLCHDFAASGIDVIKDDHYLSDQPGCRFNDRVSRCAEIVADASETHGRPIWYVPSISGEPSEVRRKVEFALEHNLRCVMLSPMALGLPLLREIASDYSELCILAHPSFSPMAAFAPEVLWGKLFRLFGADAIIFVNSGGRFNYSEETCRLVAANMTAPLLDCLPSLPVAAGGIALENVQEVIRSYGNDCMLLVGGSILRADDRMDATRRFVDTVAEHALFAN